MESVRKYSRRRALKIGVGMLGLGGLAACAPAATPQVVEREVTVIVEGTPQVQIVKETVIVPAEARPVEIRWSCYQLGEAREATGQECADEFMEQNPGIKVNLEWMPGQGYWDKLQTEFAAATAPDVVINQMNWVIPGAARGMFLDLMPFVERDDFPLDEYWYPMTEWSWRGGLYGMLLYAGMSCVYANKTLFEEAGLELPDADWDWNDMLEYGLALTDPDKNQYGIKGANNNPPYHLSAFIHAAGGSVLNEDYNKCTLTEPVAVEVVKWVADLMFVHKVMPTPASIEGLEDPFLTGNVAINFHNLYWAGMIRDASRDQGFEWDFIHFPKHPVTGGIGVIHGSNAWSVIGNTQHREESWKLAAYLGGYEGQRKWMKYGQPGFTSLVQSQEYIDAYLPQDILVPLSDAQQPGALRDYYPTADCDEWWQALGQEMSVIWSGEATVEEALQRTCAALDAIFERRPEIYEDIRMSPTT